MKRLLRSLAVAVGFFLPRATALSPEPAAREQIDPLYDGSWEMDDDWRAEAWHPIYLNAVEREALNTGWAAFCARTAAEFRARHLARRTQ